MVEATFTAPESEVQQANSMEQAARAAAGIADDFVGEARNGNATFSQPQQTPAEAPPEAKAPEAKPEKKDERPGWLPEKFKSPEDLAKAYSELEKRLGAKPPAATTPAPGEEAKPAEQANAAAPVFSQESREALTKKWFETKGKLEDGDYGPFEKAGFSRDDVNLYFLGMESLSREATRARDEAAGGSQNFSRMMEWAKQSLPKPALEMIQKSIVSLNPEETAAGGSMLRAQYESVHGRVGKPLSASQAQNTSTSGVGFANEDEMYIAQEHPLYWDQSPAGRAYRKAFDEKLRASHSILQSVRGTARRR